MADKKYISFDKTNEKDLSTIKLMGRIDLVLGLSPKQIVEDAVTKITETKDYKEKLQEFVSEDLSE